MIIDKVLIFSFKLMIVNLILNNVVSEEDTVIQTYKIEGKVSVLQSSGENKNTEWMQDTVVIVDGGNYRGFLKEDGTFVVSSIPSGTYIVEVASPNYQFELMRVDITKGGKIRVRKVNFLSINSVQTAPYPLNFFATERAAFFELREEWKVKDFLFNPMVLMMVLPFLFIFAMPKLVAMADPEAQKEMQSQMSVLNNPQKLPDLSEMMSNWFSGGEKKKKTATTVAVKKAGKRR
uniref:UPF0480 protein C15orf24 n=1 Tax=Hydra vulgaris TaxID=6087 RepID=T2M5J5_HYDVU